MERFKTPGNPQSNSSFFTIVSWCTLLYVPSLTSDLWPWTLTLLCDIDLCRWTLLYVLSLTLTCALDFWYQNWLSYHWPWPVTLTSFVRPTALAVSDDSHSRAASASASGPAPGPDVPAQSVRRMPGTSGAAPETAVPARSVTGPRYLRIVPRDRCISSGCERRTSDGTARPLCKVAGLPCICRPVRGTMYLPLVPWREPPGQESPRG